MTREETIALWQKSEDAKKAAVADGKTSEAAHEAAKTIWNGWAQELLRKRKTLEGKGVWASRIEHDETSYMTREVGLNPASQDWIAEASVNFSKLNFIPSAADFKLDDTESQDDLRIIQEQWSSQLSFLDVGITGRGLDFGGFLFPSSSDFFGTGFFAPVIFSSASFHDAVGFRRTLFKGRAYFVGTEFVGYAWFSRTTFSAEAFFERTKFHSGARFAGVEFQDIAIFSEAKFERASFLSVKFTETADFSSSWFASNAHFTSCQSDLGFFLIDANFAGEPPNFTQATFKQAPDLDSVVFPVPRFWKGHNKGRVAVYRAIRRVSVQGHDQENEAKAFKGEVRSKRGTEHRWYHAAFWYGVAYDGLSDFGSSLSRPLLVWLFSVVAFGAVYLWNARVDVPEWVKPCRFGEASKALRAFTLSIANALPVIGSSRSEEAKAFYSCVSSENIPVWSPIIQIGQTLWSAVLIFLFLLAVRNQFKIK